MSSRRKGAIRRKRSVRSSTEKQVAQDKNGEKEEKQMDENAFFNLSCVLEDVSIPDQCFTISGYFEFWWLNTFEDSELISSWSEEDVQERFGKKITDPKAEMSAATITTILQLFKDNNVNGDVFMELTEKDLHDMGITSLGVRKKIIELKEEILEKSHRHEADDHGYALDVDHLEAPLNWEDMFYNATSEEWLTEPFHRLYTKELNKEKGLQIRGTEEVIAGIYHFRADLLESMDLADFPFDKQFLDLRITCQKDGDYKWAKKRPERWVPAVSTDTVTLGNDNNQIFQVRLSEKLQCVYELHDPIVDFTTDDQVIQLRIRVDRKTSYYVSNVFAPIFFIVLGGFASAGVEMNSTDRLGITVTMFLVVVAYQYVVSDMLPLTDELTRINYYVLFSFFLMTLLVVENGVVYYITLGLEGTGKAFENYQNIDYWFNLLCICTWIVFHIAGLISYRLGFLNTSWKTAFNNEHGEAEVWLPNEEGVETLFLTREQGADDLIVTDADGNSMEHKTQWFN